MFNVWNITRRLIKWDDFLITHINLKICISSSFLLIQGSKSLVFFLFLQRWCHIPGSTPPWHDIVCFGPRPRPHGFVSRNSHENFPVSHPSWDCSRANSLNFGVPVESKANELPKSLVLGRDGNIHIRLTGSTTLGDVRSYNPPPLGARRPRQHTSGQGLALIPNCHIQARAPTTSRPRLRCSTILSSLGPGHMRTSQWVTHHGIAFARTRLTWEFQWNLNPMSSQKASC